ncbi:interferon-induced, double-stranded RNA-activated protein kinase [Stigmatopora argus]
MDSENHVAKLNEFCQRRKYALEYVDLGSEGPDHIKTFSVRVILNGETYPECLGLNKKEAKQNAAKVALEHLMKKNEEAPEASLGPSVGETAKNYVCWLNEYGHKITMEVKFHESTKPGSLKPFRCRFSIGKIEYPVAHGASKKEAKEVAARLAYEAIFETSLTDIEESFEASNLQEEDTLENDDNAPSPKTDDSYAETNFIGKINEYCQINHYTHNFREVLRSGPAHNHKFSYKLEIDGKDYPVGTGKTKKEAKHSAAHLAWTALKEILESSESSSMDSPPILSEKNTKEFAKSTPKVQDKQTDVKPRRKIAANFAIRPQDVNSPDFKDRKTGSELKSQSCTTWFENEFEDIKKIGNGGFGTVFKARHKVDEKNYAVKVVQTEKKSKREIMALTELQHRNIVRYHTSWEDGAFSGLPIYTSKTSAKYLYIQMELCDTLTLRDWIDDFNYEKTVKTVNTEQRKKRGFAIIKDIVEGVEYIHGRKLIHRDLKPANIMFALDQTVKIGDFGLVTNDDALEKTFETGTPSYMAPEQFQKAAVNYTQNVDIFALGLIYFELLWSFRARSERVKIWPDVRNQKLPADFSSLFPMEQKMIKSMLSLKPEDRPKASTLKTNLMEFDNDLVLAKVKKTV